MCQRATATTIRSRGSFTRVLTINQQYTLEGYHFAKYNYPTSDVATRLISWWGISKCDSDPLPRQRVYINK
ncbi:Glycoprotein gp2 [Fusarium oxysporum f. sp. albedinis]|nr:Glycoprotein gp2 [Fusarium oxysporum f. sp. albedinis]